MNPLARIVSRSPHFPLRRLPFSYTPFSSSSSSPVVPPSSDRFTSSLNVSTKKNAIVGDEIPTENRVPISLLSHAQERQVPSGIIATVFGAGGFIGRYALHDMCRMGSQMIVPYRGDGMKIRHLKMAGELGQVVPIPFDMTDEESIRRAVARSNVVINLLGSHLETTNYSYHDTHVNCAYRIAKIAREAGVERFIHFSALGADLESPSRYFRSKAHGEAVVKEFFPDATILRPAPVVGSQDHFITQIAYFGTKFVALPVPEGGQQKIQPVMVQDIAKAVCAVLTREETIGRTYELAGRDVFTYENLIKLVSEAMNRPVQMAKLPEPILRMYGKYLQGSDYPMWDNPNKNILIDVRNFVVGLRNRLRFNWIYYEDAVDQAKVSLTVSPNARGLQELGIEPDTLFEHIEKIMLPYKDYSTLPMYRYNPDNFVHVSRKGKRV